MGEAATIPLRNGVRSDLKEIRRPVSNRPDITSLICDGNSKRAKKKPSSKLSQKCHQCSKACLAPSGRLGLAIAVLLTGDELLCIPLALGTCLLPRHLVRVGSFGPQTTPQQEMGFTLQHVTSSCSLKCLTQRKIHPSSLTGPHCLQSSSRQSLRIWISTQSRLFV